MPKQSKSKRDRQAQRQANAPAAPPAGTAPIAPPAQTSPAPPTSAPRFVNTAPPVMARPSATVRPGAKIQRPDIKVGHDIRRIGIVTGIIVVILVVLAIVLR